MIHILNPQEKTEIEKKLAEQFGINYIPGKIIKYGKERLFLFSGDFSKEDIERLKKCAIIERLGVYFAKVIGENIKLSIEGSQILSAQITKNFLELDQKEAEEWMMGRELHIKTMKRGFLIMKHGSDFLGAGKASENKIGNFVPKNRRLKINR